MKILKSILIFLLSFSLYPDEIRVAVLGEPEELRLKVETALFNSPFCKIIELNKRKDVLNEVKLGQMGVLDEEKVARAGKLLGAQKFLTVYQKGDFNSLRLIDVETSSLDSAWVYDHKSENEENLPKMDSLKGISRVINKMLEGLAVKKALADLSNSSANKIEVKINLPKKKFKMGESLTFEVISGEDGYLTLIDIQPDGSVVQLLPNKTGQSNQIKANEVLKFPPQDIILKISQPLGKDTIKAIVTKKPLSLFPKIDLDNETISSVKQGLGVHATKGISMTIKKVPDGDWGMDEIMFDTVE